MINKNQGALSSFVVYFGVKNNEKINEFIKPRIQDFFKAKKIEKYKAVQENSEISSLDFKKVKICYFYDFILDEIAKDQEQKVVFPVKYSITLDEKNCPKKCEKTGIFYDEILLNKKPIFYFIYLDIKEIFSFLRDQKASISKKDEKYFHKSTV
ncbi:MAG: hypothetical protein D3903_06485 [Candidatus Electrothrix sp. GM3_4]|nr:hypothetical protein [Candidatus Electrothrix sp. GM3_4]